MTNVSVVLRFSKQVISYFHKKDKRFKVKEMWGRYRYTKYLQKAFFPLDKL